MKIVTKTTFIIGKNKAVGPGEIVDLKEEEARSLLERGLADWPIDETALAAETDTDETA